MTRGPVDTLESSRSVGDRQLHTVLAVEPTTTTQLVRHVALGATSGSASAIGREYASPCVLHGPMAEACVCVRLFHGVYEGVGPHVVHLKKRRGKTPLLM